MVGFLLARYNLNTRPFVSEFGTVITYRDWKTDPDLFNFNEKPGVDNNASTVDEGVTCSSHIGEQSSVPWVCT